VYKATKKTVKYWKDNRYKCSKQTNSSSNYKNKIKNKWKKMNHKLEQWHTTMNLQEKGPKLYIVI